MIISVSLILAIALGYIGDWAIFMLFITWIPDIVFVAIIAEVIMNRCSPSQSKEKQE